MKKIYDADSHTQNQPRFIAAKSISFSYRSTGGSSSKPNKRLKSSANVHSSTSQERETSNDIGPNRLNGPGSSQTRRFLTIAAKIPRNQPQTVVTNSQGSSQLPMLTQESPRNSRNRFPLAKSIGSVPTLRRASTIHPQEHTESRPFHTATKPRPKIPPRYWNEDAGDYDNKDNVMPPLRTRVRVAAASAQPIERGGGGRRFETVLNTNELGGYLDKKDRVVRNSGVTSDDSIIEVSSTEENDTVRHKLSRKLKTLSRKPVSMIVISGSDESDYGSKENDVDIASTRSRNAPCPPSHSVKAARKAACTTAVYGSDDSGPTSTYDESDSGDSEIHIIEPRESPTTRTIRHDSSWILPPSLKLRTDTMPTTELVEALRGCVLRLPEARLPFLRRNLKVGFERQCKIKGVKTTPVITDDSERASVESVYFYPIENLDGTGYGRLTKGVEAWRCPLCFWHLNFANRNVLQQHLDWDHSEVRTRWTESKVEKWTIEMILPAPSPEAGEGFTGSRHTHPNFAFATCFREHVFLEPHRSSYIKNVLEDKGKARAVSMASDHSKTRFSSRASMAPDSRSTTTMKTSRSPDPDIKLKKRSVSPPILEFDEDSRNPLGPTAQYPFLPAQSEDGMITLNYSCRIGGPKIYDLLSTLSLEPFGVLSWVVVDREEEIFEVDDVKDEYKVMHALWARWIILNRTAFIRNYHEGVRMFINEYWTMMQRAAGWEALRYWLMMLLANRFLTGHEVAQLLKYYQGKIGWEE